MKQWIAALYILAPAYASAQSVMEAPAPLEAPATVIPACHADLTTMSSEAVTPLPAVEEKPLALQLLESVKTDSSLIGLFEVETRFGETILSKIYFPPEEARGEEGLGRPISDQDQQDFLRRLAPRTHSVVRVTKWIYAPKTGGVVRESIEY